MDEINGNWGGGGGTGELELEEIDTLSFVETKRAEFKQDYDLTINASFQKA